MGSEPFGGEGVMKVVRRALVLGLWLAAALGAADPVAGIYGNTGLWKVLSADTLAAGQISASTWYDRINRNPGYLTISTAGFGGAWGITDRIELGVSVEANRHLLVGRAGQLSFGQQSLGLFGNQTPGSPPLPSELMPGSSRVPQLRSPAAPSGALTGAAGYYNLLPFAGLVGSGGAAGSISLGIKLNVLTENSGAPFGLAIRPYADVPIHKDINFLLTHPVGTADLQFGLDGIVSKRIGNAVELSWNAGYRRIDQPAHVSIIRLAEEMPLGFGLTVPLTKRIQFVAEATAEVFLGADTANTTFGPEDPLDVTVGFRGRVARSLSLSAGYRRPLNQFGGDKNGFVMSVGYTRSAQSH